MDWMPDKVQAQLRAIYDDPQLSLEEKYRLAGTLIQNLDPATRAAEPMPPGFKHLSSQDQVNCPRGGGKRKGGEMKAATPSFSWLLTTIRSAFLPPKRKVEILVRVN